MKSPDLQGRRTPQSADRPAADGQEKLFITCRKHLEDLKKAETFRLESFMIFISRNKHQHSTGGFYADANTR